MLAIVTEARGPPRRVNFRSGELNQRGDLKSPQKMPIARAAILDQSRFAAPMLPALFTFLSGAPRERKTEIEGTMFGIRGWKNRVFSKTSSPDCHLVHGRGSCTTEALARP